MIGFILGAATGYVLGARAGRERYEQLVRTYHRVAEHPTVQSAAGIAREKVSGAVGGKIWPDRNGRAESARTESARTDLTPSTAGIPRA